MDHTSEGLQAVDLSKRYGQTQALDAISLQLRPGVVHGLVGHNGAGKSTLLRMLSGAERADSGDVLLDGQRIQLASPRDAIERGISCVYQELSLVEELSVAQNLFLGRELRRGMRLALTEMERETATYLAEYGLAVDPSSKVRELTVAQRQLVEVITALHRKVRFLLLDEPTSALEISQVEQLLATIARVARERGVGVLLVDHKIDEVVSVADEVTVLRNGRVVLSGPRTAVRREDVVNAILGTDGNGHAEAPALELATQATGARDERGRAEASNVPALEVRGLRSEHLHDVSLRAMPGRVLGIYGLVGSGRTNLLRTLYGVEDMTGGEILLHGRPYRPRGPEAAITAGIAYLPEERKTDGFIPLLSPVSNATLPVLRRYIQLGVIRGRRATVDAQVALDAVDVKGDRRAPMHDLSGGNQQKVLFARVIVQHPLLLLLDEPTKGVDIGAKREIHRIIRSLVSGSRIAALVVSSEEEEILEVADEVVVFRRGVCDGTLHSPDRLAPGDLRRLAWVAAEEGVSVA